MENDEQKRQAKKVVFSNHILRTLLALAAGIFLLKMDGLLYAIGWFLIILGIAGVLDSIKFYYKYYS